MTSHDAAERTRATADQRSWLRQSGAVLGAAGLGWLLAPGQEAAFAQDPVRPPAGGERKPGDGKLTITDVRAIVTQPRRQHRKAVNM